MDLAAAQYPEVDEFIHRHQSQERLFVKNLENIQGDERDVIFISVGYGRDKFDAQTMHGTIIMEAGITDFEPCVQLGYNVGPVATPEAGCFDFMPVEQFDAFVTMLIQLRDALFASGWTERKRLVPLP